MTPRLVVAAGTVACLLIAMRDSARAQTPTLIGFEDLPVGVRVDTQYLRQGLRVSSVAAIDTAPRSHGGRQLLVAISPATLAAARTARPLILVFVRPQSFVRLFLGTRSRAQGRLFGTVEAFDSNRASLGRDGPRELKAEAAAVGFGLTVPDARIAFVTARVVDSTPNGARLVPAAIDDLEFGVTPPPLPPIIVPSLRGLTPAAAAARLKDLQLRLGGRRDSMTDRFRPGTIVDQAPPRGTAVKPGTSVSVRVARPTPPPAPRPRNPLPLIVAVVAGLAVGAAVARRAWRRLRWRVATRAHAGLESLRPRLTAPRDESLEIRLVPVSSRGTQQLREGS